MDVRIDAAGEDEEARGVDLLAAAQARGNGHDAATADTDVGGHFPIGIDHGSAANDQIAHQTCHGAPPADTARGGPAAAPV